MLDWSGVNVQNGRQKDELRPDQREPVLALWRCGFVALWLCGAGAQTLISCEPVLIGGGRPDIKAAVNCAGLVAEESRGFPR